MAVSNATVQYFSGHIWVYLASCQPSLH